MSFLPSDKYKNKLILYNDFNNELIRGHNQGLTLYNYDNDLTLYKKLDTKDLEKVNFDDINNDLNNNRNIFENTKSLLSGTVEGVAEGGSNALGYTLEKAFNGIKNGLGFDTKTIVSYLGLFLLAIIIFKKI